MFTLDQIHLASNKVKSGADFPQLVLDLQAIGVTHFDTHVADGTAEYFGLNGFSVQAGPIYPTLPIADEGSAARVKHAITIHQQGQTDYPRFCNDAANAGVVKWTVDFAAKTVTYFDRHGVPLVVEPF